MKSIMSGQTVALGIYRRVAHAVSLRKKSQHHERATKDDAANNDFTALNVGVVQEEDEEHHRGDRFLFLESEGETDVNNYLNREALYSDSRSDHSTPESQGDAQMIAEIENQFWDADGVARLGGGSDEHRNSSHEVVDRLHDGPHLQLWCRADLDRRDGKLMLSLPISFRKPTFSS
ncbi:Hypothetical protein, putative [Bodo saltans]|uniref:Uncharacterized protein n=1 Tax=Bodo saltans TaxID=75058 RepID=A0A0S4JRS4_BODSA|nr:Hypothetical protein, putative [Bodo saltans]|eukprot:CUG91778.1 Hypothetical protein, putative [Bodo saltans]